jgi:hypothetical protein
VYQVDDVTVTKAEYDKIAARYVDVDLETLAPIKTKSTSASGNQFADIIEAFKTYENSNWAIYDSPLIADSFLVIPQLEWGYSPQDWNLSHAGSGFNINNGHIVYNMQDINNNGSRELFIGVEEKYGTDSYYYLFGMYAIIEGKATSIIQGDGPNNELSVYIDGTFGKTDGNPGYWYDDRYSLSSTNTLITEYEYNYTGMEDPDPAWLAEIGEDMAQYSDTKIDFNWKNLSDFTGGTDN